MNDIVTVPMVGTMFSESAIRKIESYNLGMATKIGKDFYNIYLRIIRSLSILDVKQLIYIYRIVNEQSINLDFLSEDDILIEINTIVHGFNDPTRDLGNLLRYKTNYLLPINTHSWLKKNLPAMLVYTHIIPSELKTKVFYGIDELAECFDNMINFSIPDIDYLGNETFRKIDFRNPIDKDKIHGRFMVLKDFYLKHEIPRSKFKKIERATDEQLDAILDSLEKYKIRILKDIFYPIDRDDKIYLIIASINAIPLKGVFEEKDIVKDEFATLTVEKGRDIQIYVMNGMIVLGNDVDYPYDVNKYKCIEVQGYKHPDDISKVGNGHFLANPLPVGTYTIRYVGKKQSVQVVKSREQALARIENLLKSRNQRAKKKSNSNKYGEEELN